MTDPVWQYLSIEVGCYGWRGLGFGYERWNAEIMPDGRWYPIWSLKLGPVIVKWLRYSRLPLAESLGRAE